MKSINSFTILIVFLLLGCAGTQDEEPNLADRRLTEIEYEKHITENQGKHDEDIRPTIKFFYRIVTLLRDFSLEKEEKILYAGIALKQLEGISTYDEAWTGEHAESGDQYLSEIFVFIGDEALCDLLSGKDYSTIRPMLVWLQLIDVTNYPKSAKLLRSEKRVDFPLFSGYGRVMPNQWKKN